MHGWNSWSPGATVDPSGASITILTHMLHCHVLNQYPHLLGLKAAGQAADHHAQGDAVGPRGPQQIPDLHDPPNARLACTVARRTGRKQREKCHTCWGWKLLVRLLTTMPRVTLLVPWGHSRSQ